MHTFITVVRVILLIVAAGAILLSLVFAVLAVNAIPDDGELASRLIATFLPLSSRESDYVGRGWHYRQAQWYCTLIFILCMLAWAFLGSFDA